MYPEQAKQQLVQREDEIRRALACAEEAQDLQRLLAELDFVQEERAALPFDR